MPSQMVRRKPLALPNVLTARTGDRLRGLLLDHNCRQTGQFLCHISMPVFARTRMERINKLVGRSSRVCSNLHNKRACSFLHTCLIASRDNLPEVKREGVMTTKQTCSICDGTGVFKQPSGKESSCQNCAGTGIIVGINAPIEEERNWPRGYK
jgi:hypothetical protein